LQWIPAEPSDIGIRFRASLEALANLVALGVQEHEAAGQHVTRITVSGGIARSQLMGEILATVLNRPLERLHSAEGPALGAAVTALAALESHYRRQKDVKETFSVADAVDKMVRFSEPNQPVPAWTQAYRQGLDEFRRRLR
jgi:sugar (pentulose or hexulose) kinase